MNWDYKWERNWGWGKTYFSRFVNLKKKYKAMLKVKHGSSRPGTVFYTESLKRKLPLLFRNEETTLTGTTRDGNSGLIKLPSENTYRYKSL